MGKGVPGEWGLDLEYEVHRKFRNDHLVSTALIRVSQTRFARNLI